MSPARRQILVTGSGGKIGRRVVRDLGLDHAVLAVDTRSADLGNGVRACHLDIVREPARLSELVTVLRPDAIVHLSALTGRSCEGRGDAAMALNTEATARLAHVARAAGVERFVFTSTSAVYRQATLQPTREDENVDPRSVYARSKYLAERALDSVAAVPGQGTQFTTLRIFNVYGTGFAASLVERLRLSTADDPVDLSGWDNFHRDYIHVDEVVRAIRLAVTAGSSRPGHSTMNIASGVARSNAGLVAELTGSGLRPCYRRGDGPDPADVSWADVTRARELLGFQASAELACV